MRVRCIHGYFIFNETSPGDVARFKDRYGLTLVAKDDYFTFEQLKDAPDYSFEGEKYLDADSIETFEGNPWDVMRENEIVYDFNTGVVKPIASVVSSANLQMAGSYWIAPGLVLPGATDKNNRRVSDYNCFIIWETNSFRYTQVKYE